jgi:phosphoserine phosphatase RsbU/P
MDPFEDKTLGSLRNHPDWLKRVLIVEDDEISLEALKMCLEKADLEIHTAADGENAVKQLGKTSFAAIICDKNLPGIDGLEVLKRALEIQPDTIRLVVTGAANLSDAADLINITQISHFILKPWDYNVLMRAVVSSVEKFNLIKENKKLNEIIRNELIIGGRVQNLLLEGKFPEDLPGIDIEGLTIPSRFLDADFYDFHRPADHLLDVIVGDVMGKGLPAALVGLAVKTHFIRFASPLNVGMSYSKPKGWHSDVLQPDDIMQQVKNELYHPLNQLEKFVTLFYGRLDFKEQRLSYVDCGSQKPIHFRQKSQEAALIKGDNFPLGIGGSEEVYTLKEIAFEKGDIIVFYSDGITEAKSPDGKLFGICRLINLVKKNSEKKAAELIKTIRDEVAAFTQSSQYEDDLTLIAVKIAASTPLDYKPSQNVAKFSSHISQLNAVRKFVENYCLQVSQKTSSIVHLLQLAVDELFCNIVNHSLKNENGHEIIIQADFNENGLIFEILDQGEPFSPSEIKHPDMAGNKEGGYGFYLVKQIADTITYQRKKTPDGWNCIRIVKNIKMEGESMDISHYKQDGIVVITLEGDNLDARETPDFKKKITELIEKERTHHVVLDLSNLNFIDSTGLGGFLSLLRLLDGESGDLKLANMTTQVKTIFDLVCMNKIFEIHDSVDDAVKAFATGTARPNEN